MTGSVVALNCGSSSIKLAAWDQQHRLQVRGQAENIAAGLTPKLVLDGVSAPLATEGSDHASILDQLIAMLERRLGPPAAVGHRVVHGGTGFARPVVIDAAVRSEIERLTSLAPSHQPHNLAGIDAVARAWPTVPQVAVFDTAFHRTIARHRQLLPVPQRFAQEGLLRFGFHGISYEGAAARLPELLGERASGAIVICHLGNGCSLAGLKHGRSAYTSMGFTPLDGLMMGRRPGRMDPGAVLWLVDRHGGDAEAVRRLLNQESGLLGISGVSSDMRDLLGSSEPDARLAIDMFIDRLLQEIAAAAAAIGGLDAIVFTGGIGEYAAEIRRRVIVSLAWLGFDLDQASNEQHGATITCHGRKPSAHVLPCDEEALIATAARELALQ